MYILIKISFLQMLRNVFPAILGTIVFSLMIMFLPKADSIIENILYIILAYIVYLTVVVGFKTERELLVNLVAKLMKPW